MKQTAVEWFIEQLLNNENIRWRGTNIIEFGEQAKEMEKKQHWATWGNGVANAENEKLFQDHWNQTYGGGDK
jgi:hypothetical protein